MHSNLRAMLSSPKGSWNLPSFATQRHWTLAHSPAQKGESHITGQHSLAWQLQSLFGISSIQHGTFSLYMYCAYYCSTDEHLLVLSLFLLSFSSFHLTYLNLPPSKMSFLILPPPPPPPPPLCSLHLSNSNRAECYLKTNQLVEAIRDCNKALAMNPRNLKARWRRAQALQSHHKNYPAALDLL